MLEELREKKKNLFLFGVHEFFFVEIHTLLTYFLSLFFIFSRFMELCTWVLAPWKFVT